MSQKELARQAVLQRVELTVLIHQKGLKVVLVKFFLMYIRRRNSIGSPKMLILVHIKKKER